MRFSQTTLTVGESGLGFSFDSSGDFRSVVQSQPEMNIKVDNLGCLRLAWSIICALLGSVVTAGVHADTPILVGVLEDVEPGNLSPGMATAHVRLAFEYTNRTWNSLRLEYPSPVNWTVVFDGRAIGAIESRASPSRAYIGGDVGIETITSRPSVIPHVSVGASRFDYTGNKARNRPLLLISTSHVRDPDHWKPAALSVDERKIAIDAFRRKVPSLEQCDQPEEEPIHIVPYSDGEVIFIQGYRSKSGELLVGERLDDTRSNCGFFDDPVFFDYWFALRGQTARFLDTQMVPMDAADLADTGSSVWVFQTSRGEDEDGYELFYEDFSKKVSINWTYH